MMSFKDFLSEMEAVDTDVEDLTPQQLQAKAVQMKKIAALKSSGREDQANKLALRELQQELRDAKDPRQKADIQRRIKELNAPKPAGEV